jgi:hypothetical protein
VATRVAQKTGSWSDLTVWDGGLSLPGSGDIVQTGNFLVTIDQNVDLSPGGQLNPTGSGAFLISAARTITADVNPASTYANGGVYSTHATGTVILNGSILAGGTGIGWKHQGLGTLTISGNVTGGSASHGLRNDSTGTVNIIGNVTGGSGGSARWGVYTSSTGAVNVTGTVTAGSAGNCHGVIGNVAATITINGSVIASSSASCMAVYNGTGICTINGSVTGGSAAAALGAYNPGVGTLTINGTVTGGSNATAYGAQNDGTGTLNVATAQGSSTLGAAGLRGGNAAGTTTYKQAVSETNGASAVSGFCKMLIDPTNSITVKRSDTGADYVLRPATGGPRFGLASGGIL